MNGKFEASKQATLLHETKRNENEKEKHTQPPNNLCSLNHSNGIESFNDGKKHFSFWIAYS